MLAACAIFFRLPTLSRTTSQLPTLSAVQRDISEGRPTDPLLRSMTTANAVALQPSVHGAKGAEGAHIRVTSHAGEPLVYLLR